MSDDFSIEVLWEEMKKELEKEGYTKREPKEVLGEQLKEFRVKRKMSVAEAAKKSGFSTGTISNYENGKTSPTWNDLQILSFTYDFSLYDFLGIEKADYESDCNVFKRYGLSETFYRELFFAKKYGVHNDILNCINLIFEYPLYAATLFEKLSCFFNISFHEQIDHIPLKLPPDASLRLLLEPVIRTLGDIFNAKYPERQKNAILSLLGQHQTAIQASLFDKTQSCEK
ncbi:helix-turn-helix domain-containing protein [Vermiculatibacterium agrestimuris]|uniref:helix-turn-helix domain-containing protein n=1 Tax=Vermiculatibacterium agrestimuris TaxID=2941519 RepID=UPI002041008F|nr:helix-turn-helix transcriptional regulator [Vermiculatibacterium agrestimuris]